MKQWSSQRDVMYVNAPSVLSNIDESIPLGGLYAIDTKACRVPLPWVLRRPLDIDEALSGV